MLTTVIIVSALFSAISCDGLKTPVKVQSTKTMSFQRAYKKFKPELQQENVLMASQDDVKQRAKIFKKARREINSINKDSSKGFSAEVNQFSILSDEEKKSFSGFNVSSVFKKGSRSKRRLQKRGPDTLNWWPDYVTDVKNQGYCGSCWAFTGMTVLESRSKIAGGSLTQYSEQEILDCNSEGDECQGGYYDTVWKYAQDNGRLASSEDYSYEGAKGSCRSGSKSDSLDTRVSDYNTYGGWDEDDLVMDLKNGPVAIAVYASDAMHYYSDGDFTDCVDTNLDHAVTAVGYDADIFFVRNSWGSNWGISGYIRMSRNVCTGDTYSYYSAYVTMTKSSIQEVEEEE